MDRNAYIWLLLVIYRRHDKCDKRCPAIDTDESDGVMLRNFVSRIFMRTVGEISVIDDRKSYGKRIVTLSMRRL